MWDRVQWKRSKNGLKDHGGRCNERRGSNLHPTQRHDDDDEHLCLAVHLKIPDHDRRNGDDDDIHEDTEGAGREDECARVDALASRDDFAVGSYSVHGGSTPCVFDR